MEEVAEKVVDLLRDSSQIQVSLGRQRMDDGTYYYLAFKEYALAYGREEPDRAWILTPMDTWEPNPFYRGPPVRHPEEDPEED